jgi:SAM-dependent methyltransferase
MSRLFDRDYWAAHWGSAPAVNALPAHPALETELTGLQPGTAVDAGSGEGAEAVWLSYRGWDVTAVDISAEAIRRASARFDNEPGVSSVSWIEADLTVWEPRKQFDLVTTFYAHPTIPQHTFYRRISHWVAPGGTLLIVGHHHATGQSRGHGRGHAPPGRAATGPEQVRALFDTRRWAVHTAEIRERVVDLGSHRQVTLQDVVARAERI